MRYDGRIDIDDDGRALAVLSFDPNTASQSHLCELFALVALRLMSNLKGRSESILIATDCKKPYRDLSKSTGSATETSIRRRRKPRHFFFSSIISDDGAQFFDFQAKGFGLLAKGVGEAARSAVNELRTRLVEAVPDGTFHRQMDLASAALAEIGISGIVTLSNQAPLAHSVASEATEAVDRLPTNTPNTSFEHNHDEYEAVQLRSRLADLRCKFGNAAGLDPLSDIQKTALRSLQVNAITEVIGRWIGNPSLKHRATEALRSIVHDGDPQTCTAINLQLADDAPRQQDAERLVASWHFSEFASDPDTELRFLNELLFLRLDTVRLVASYLGDRELSQSVSEDIAQAAECLERLCSNAPTHGLDPDIDNGADDESITESLLQELWYVDGSAFGQTVTHLTDYIDPLEKRKFPVVTEYKKVAPALAALDTDELWEYVQLLAPTAKHDGSEPVRASAKLLVTAMTCEIMNREELSRKDRRRRIERAQTKYITDFKTNRISLDFGTVIMNMAGQPAASIPPAV